MVDWQSESDLDSIRNSCDVYFLHFALQCPEHDKDQNMPLPKIGPNWRILAKNPIFGLGYPIFVPG